MKSINRQFNFSGLKNVQLEKNRNHQFAVQHAQCLYNRNALYSYIPKNACSTMRLTAAFDNGLITDPRSEFGWIHNNNHVFVPDLEFMIKAKYSFVVLRCPYSRVASAFIDKIVSISPRALRFLEQSKSEVGILELNFHEFLKMIKAQKDENRDHHWRTQSSFLLYKQYDDYFCVEEFHQMIIALQQKLQMKIIDARPYIKHDAGSFNIVSDKDYSHSSLNILNKMKREGSVPDYKCLLSSDNIQLIKDIYADDLNIYKEIFGSQNLIIS